MKTLNDLLDRAAREDGPRPALVTEETSLTYAELHALVLKTAAGLAAAGVKRGERVAIVHRNSPVFVTAYFALARLGAVAVPINFMVQKAEELAYMLNDCRATGVVTQKEFLKGIRAAGVRSPSLAHIWVTDASTQECEKNEQPFSALSGAGLGAERRAEVVNDSDVAAILYTSGTTGFPKGVMLTHRNMVSNCEAIAADLALGSRDVPLCILPMFHTFAWTGNVLLAVRFGLKLVICPAIVPARPWLNLMARHGVTVFTAVPQLYAVLAKEAAGLRGLLLRWWFFRRVRLAVSGSAPLSPAVQHAFESALRVPILEGYGLTETSPAATFNTPSARRPGSVGRPVPGVRVKIVGDQEKELPAGQEGEICIRGDNVMKGYYNLTEATREAFTKDGWFKSGDIGVIDAEGYLHIRDRKKDMIIVKGLKVFPAQIEAVLLEHPDVSEAAVVGIPDGHGDETIKAFVVARQGAAVDKAALMQYCRARFDPYKRPRDIELVASLPKNALQKVLKRELRRQELERKAAGRSSGEGCPSGGPTGGGAGQV